MIKDFSDLTVYVTRLNVLEKNSLSILKDIYKDKKLNNLTVLVNGVDYSDGNGVRKGYGYGSYFDHSKKKKILNLFKQKK